MNQTQVFSIGAVVVLIGGTATAIHFDREKRAKAAAELTNGPKVVREPDALEPPLTNSKTTAAVPMSLTASDGTGLVLTALSAKVVAEDPLAFTELRLVFENPLDRVIEGNFSITLPTGASVGRFAMKLGELWQEGEVVEKQAARKAYEDFLHRRQDPALLEQGAGNEFTARVFPIPARGRKELIISYSQELAGRAYVLPLRGLPKIGVVEISATNENKSVVGTLRETNWLPNADFTLGHGAVGATPGLRADNLIVARVFPLPESHPDRLDAPVILFDTSASRGLGFEEQIALLQRLVKKIAEDAPREPITVAAFDQTTEIIFAGDASAFGEKELAKIRDRGALGASNVQAALAFVTEHARTAGRKRLVMITDGVATAGENDGEKLAASVVRMKTGGIERLDAIAVGGIRDESALRRLTTAGLVRDGAVLDGRLVISALSRRLNEATRSHVPVKVEGATWSYPTSVDGVQAGDEILVYAEVAPQSGNRIAISTGDNGPFVPVAVRTVERPLIERSWAKAKIESLVAAGGSKPETQKAVVDLSIKHRVTSPYTSFLVLETEDDYARFKIDRNALTDILTVDEGRLAVRHRAGPDFEKLKAAKEASLRLPPPSPVPPSTAAAASGMAATPPPTTPTATGGPGAPNNDPNAPTAPWGRDDSLGSDPMSARGNMWGDGIGDAFGAGGLGLAGVGEGGGGRGEGIGLGNVGTLGHGAGTGTGQGFGNGHGRLGGAHQTRTPSLRQGATQVNGRLPPEVVQRIVRQNFGRFRLCYENGLRNNPTLQGRVTVTFVIDRSGAVSTARDGGSELPDQGVVGCVVRAFGNLSFPQPEGGIVTVNYPIIFNPGDGDVPSGRGNIGDPPPSPREPPIEKPARTEPYVGKFKVVMDALAKHSNDEAMKAAIAWRTEAPGDVMALTALGEVFEATGDKARAERAYGSVIDLFSSRADLRRFAGIRLERIKDRAAIDLALDSFEKAVAQRPDHPQSHRLYAYALLKSNEHERAFEAMKKGAEQKYPSGRFAGVEQIMKEDLGLIAAAWVKADPKRTDEIFTKLKAANGTIEAAPSTRFVLNWETDANDVDFHIYDGKGGHAYYSQKSLPSGGELYADVTTGYGPECFTIRKSAGERSGPYTLQANYYSIGPMGYGMGKLQIIEHDGKGGLSFEERPYVVMVNHAFVDLGTVK